MHDDGSLRRAATATAESVRPDDDWNVLDAYWRAANYLSAGQIYLLDNPLLREPLRPEHIKPRLLGHWGTTLGLNFVYAHLNRVIKRDDLNAIFIAARFKTKRARAASPAEPLGR
jgi:xylulose-5-phosphate/fructose-6-phosphate phosphoketolase